MKSQNRTLTLCTVVVATALAALATPAFAQDTTTTTTTTIETPPPVKHVGRSSGEVGNGGFGVGASAFVSGLFGPEIVYDFGMFHVGGLMAFDRRPAGGGPNPGTQATFQMGLSGWYHLHIGESSDFSIGGGFGFVNFSPAGPGPSVTGFEVEPGAQVRAFLTPNVALHAGMAVVLAFGDQAGVLQKQLALSGQLTGNFGFTYFFR